MQRKVENSRVLITGGAGFIGCNLTQRLLEQDNEVVVIDSFITGKRKNLTPFEANPNFTLIEGDIRDFELCRKAMEGVDFVLHEAALGSVSRSMENPRLTLEINANGFTNVIEAARQAKVKRFVYATSSSVYGDDANVPKQETKTGKALSPYALSKQLNESVAESYNRIYGFETIGLRYFNVFGRRQDPFGAYAAVIPKFVMTLMKHESPVINGDGSYSRDFTYIDNVIQANELALLADNPDAVNTVYNTAFGERTTLKELFAYLRENLSEFDSEIAKIEPTYGPNRAGDIPHSLASIDKAKKLVGYAPEFSVKQGLKQATKWYFENL